MNSIASGLLAAAAPSLITGVAGLPIQAVAKTIGTTATVVGTAVSAVGSGVSAIGNGNGISSVGRTIDTFA